MFATAAFAILVAIGLSAGYANRNDGNAESETLMRQTRQDLRVAVYLLAAILVMLGLIADRIH